MREHEVLVLACGAAVTNVGHEHIWQSIKHIVVVGSTSDCDRRAVHVHFSVANLVEPSPSHRVFTVRHALRHGVLERRVAGVSRRPIGIASFGIRTSAENGVNDLPLTVLGGLFVESDRKLTRATSMCCATLERQRLWNANWNLVHCADIVDSRSLFAREIRSIGFERAVVEAVRAIRYWAGDDHVCVDGRYKQTAGRSCGKE